MVSSEGHKKSRLGCTQCKQRRVKCDEQRPLCNRCRKARRCCSYLYTYHTLEDGPSVGTLWRQDVLAAPGRVHLTAISSFHLELFHGFHSQAYAVLGPSEELADAHRRLVLQRGFQVSFVLQATLALSALHIVIYRGANEHILYAATALQSQALQSFDRANLLGRLTAENVLDVVLFQHITALHVFCDTLKGVTNLDEMLNGLTRCIGLLQGVESVTKQWWSVLQRTELGMMLRACARQGRDQAQPGSECTGMLNMIELLHLQANIANSYRQSIHILQQCIDAEKRASLRQRQSVDSALTWLMAMDTTFAVLVQHRQPAALIILAHFSIVLHSRRHSWIVGRSAQVLLRTIAAFLGEQWAPALVVPESIVFSLVTEDA